MLSPTLDNGYGKLHFTSKGSEGRGRDGGEGGEGRGKEKGKGREGEMGKRSPCSDFTI